VGKKRMTSQQLRFCVKHFDRVAVRFSSKKCFFSKVKSVAFQAVGEE
jgi:hypothetical protein